MTPSLSVCLSVFCTRSGHSKLCKCVCVCLSCVSLEQGGTLSCAAESQVLLPVPPSSLLCSSALCPRNEQRVEAQRAEDKIPSGSSLSLSPPHPPPPTSPSLRCAPAAQESNGVRSTEKCSSWMKSSLPLTLSFSLSLSLSLSGSLLAVLCRLLL